MSIEKIYEGDDVLMRGSDGLIYLGVAVELEENRRCEKNVLVRFGDGTETWSRRQDLRHLGSGGGFVENPSSSDTDAKTGSTTSGSTVLKPSKAYSKLSPTPAIHVLQARKELPYDFDSLLWDENHQRNDKERYCYCGESGDWYKKMLQCDQCRQWFHQECIRSNQLPPLLLGDRYYEFVCTLCTGTSEEFLRRKDLNWTDAIHLALFNLTVTNNNKYHDVATSIIPFIKKKWKDLQGPSGWLKPSRLEPNFIVGQLTSHKSRFRCGSASKNRTNYWGLRKVSPPSSSRTPVNGDLSGLKPFKLRNCKVKSDTNRRPAMKTPANDNLLGSSSAKENVAKNGTKRLILFPCKSTSSGKCKKIRIDSLDSIGESDNSATYGKGTLDQLIPPPENFHGHNNPFWELVGPPLLLPQIDLPVCKVKSSNYRLCRSTWQRRSSGRKRQTRDGFAVNGVYCKCNLEMKSAFTALSNQEVDSCSNSVSSSDGNNPPPLLDCSTPSLPKHRDQSDSENPPTLDLFQPPRLPTNGINRCNYCGLTSDLNSLEVKTTKPTHLSARRLTLDGDIQYLLDREDCDGCGDCDKLSEPSKTALRITNLIGATATGASTYHNTSAEIAVISNGRSGQK